jgi:hypothetical protein
VEQEHRCPRLLGGPLEAAVPVHRPAVRIRQAAAAVAVDELARAHLHPGDDLGVELCEEPVLQRPVLLEILHRVAGAVLRVELGALPDLQVGPAVEGVDPQPEQQQEGADRAVADRAQHPRDASPDRPPHGARV